MESAFCDPGLKLIETFGWDGTRFVRLDRHRCAVGNLPDDVVTWLIDIAGTLA